MVQPTDSDAALNGIKQPRSEENTDSENAVKDYSLKIRADSQLVKLPHFISSDPKLWFDLIEIIFEAQKITEQKLKYANVIMAVETGLILEMEEIFKSTIAECNYDILKSKILEKYKKIKEDEIKKMLSNELLNKRTPTEFLQHLRNVAGNILPEKDLSDLLIHSLPKDVQEPLEKLLGLEDSMTLEKLAKQATVLVDFHYKIVNKNMIHANVSTGWNSPETIQFRKI